MRSAYVYINGKHGWDDSNHNRSSASQVETENLKVLLVFWLL